MAGVDLSKHALRRAAKRQGSIEFAVASVYDLPVADQQIDPMESLLRCPLCAQPLDRQDTRYLCPRGHSFDRAAAGYVHLLPANKLHSKDPGDDKAMAAARNRFLSGGYYDPLRDALTRLALAYAPDRAQIDPYGLTRTLGEIEVCRSSDGEPLRWVGNSAVVFKIRCGSRYKMLKCYTRPMEHLEAIYQEKLLRQELYVWQADGQGEWCDVVVDDWIEGITLYEAVMRGAGSGDKAHLSNLARQFDRLALELLESDWAHGDLKPENILLDESGTLRPVDFDAMFLPVFAGEKSPELGTAAYQHPGRTAEDFDASIDDYSIATISTTLHALALEPGLLARYNRGEGLLLSPREIVRHGCAAHAECLALFEKAGDAVRYRIARLLESPLMRLPNLKPLVRYAVCGPETPADRGELFVRDGLWGFKIRERELIPPIYDAGFDFSEGLAAVRTERCWHFIDPTGAVAIDCSDCNAVKPFANGRAIVVRDGQRLAIGRKEPRTTLHI